MDYYWDFSIILKSMPVFWRGIIVTVELTVVSLALGLVIGCSSHWQGSAATACYSLPERRSSNSSAIFPH